MLLSLEGEVKLADFGVSAKISDSITKRTSVVGSPYYMAPEIFLAQEYDFRADIWSVGITAIEMATVSTFLRLRATLPIITTKSEMRYFESSKVSHQDSKDLISRSKKLLSKF